MQGTSKVRSGRAKKKRAPIEAREDESNAENDETGETFEGDEVERAPAAAPTPSGPLRSGNFVMVWFLIPLVLVLLYGLFSR